MEVALTWHNSLYRLLHYYIKDYYNNLYCVVVRSRGSYQTRAKRLSGASPASSTQISVTLHWWSPTSPLEIASQAFWLCPVPQGHGGVPHQKSQSGQNEGKFRIQIKRVDVGSAHWSHWGKGQCGQGFISPSMFWCIKSQGGGSNIAAEILMLPKDWWCLLTGEVGAVGKATQCLLKEFHSV